MSRHDKLDKAFNDAMIKVNENTRGGLISQELEISEHLVEAWNMFTRLEQTHPSDIEDFQKAIHVLQNVLGMRAMRRLYPDFWISHKKES